MEMQGAAAPMGPLRGPGSKGSEGSEGGGIALAGDEYICRLPAATLPLAAKTIQPRLRRVEMHPYSRCAGLPPEVEVCPLLSLGTHKYLKA